jgi:hypothetical protein
MIVTVVQFVFPFDQSRLHPIDMHLVGNNARLIVTRQLRLMNRHKIRHSLSRDIRQVDVPGLRICAILWTHRSTPPQFWATDVPARKNVNKNRPIRPPKAVAFAIRRFLL